MTTSPPQIPPLSTPSPNPAPTSAVTSAAPPSPKYGGFTRFEIELEFVQSLANPSYLLHLASSTTSPSASTDTSTAGAPTPLLHHPPFIAYLSYLQYWTRPPYSKYLNYPGPTLKHLQLLQNERFREEVLKPEVVARLGEDGIRATMETYGGRL